MSLATSHVPVNNLANVGAVRSLMRRIDNLVKLAADPNVCDGQREVARRQMQEAVERELGIARCLRVR